MTKIKDVYTSGEVAKICGVAPRSASKWIDSGRLKGYRIPGGGRRCPRRVRRESLLAFMRAHGLPLNGLDVESRRLVLLIGAGNWTNCDLPALLGTEGYTYQAVDCTFDAGIIYREKKPAVVVIDFALGRLESLHITNVIAHDHSNEGVLLVGLAPEDEPDPERLTVHGFRRVFKKPINPAAVADFVSRHCAGEPVARERELAVSA